MIIRKLQINDYDQYINLLSKLTIVTYDKLKFESIFKKISDNIYIILDNDIIIATGTLLIEYKFIHDYKNVGHIEDVVVHDDYRYLGIGSKIIQHLVDIAKQNNCYKIILNCNEKLKNFYNKNGFTNTNIEMSLYF